MKQAGESRLVVIENEKWKKLQKEHGIKTNFLTMGLNMFQGIILVCWAGLVQRFSFNVEDYPEMMTGGFLWFKDLSMSDPYLILPLINSLAMVINLYVKLTYLIIEYKCSFCKCFNAKNQKIFIYCSCFFKYYHVHFWNWFYFVFCHTVYFNGPN